MTPRTLFFGVTAVLGIAFDQFTKRWIVANLELHDEISIIDNYLALTHAQNTGAAFSMLEGAQTLFLVVTVLAIVIVLDFLRRLEADARLHAVTLAMVFSGIIGNGIDRLLYGRVTDMVKCYVGSEPGYSWLMDRFNTNVYPIWNVADALLVVGVITFLLHVLFQSEQEPRLDEEDPSPAAN